MSLIITYLDWILLIVGGGVVFWLLWVKEW
ncbi:Uncharacterised protein [Yersinia aldovae]|uniref:Uncharacterized protein n=1 Tax=Yersinia aldovae TaxID=29483 RepID=A0ABM9SVC0_YERAL|nr:Uncharacterised protein [Yersinia aldovae]